MDIVSSVVALKAFLRGTCPAILNLEGSEFEKFDSALESDDSNDLISKFASSADAMVLFVEKSVGEPSIQSNLSEGNLILTSLFLSN